MECTLIDNSGSSLDNTLPIHVQCRVVILMPTGYAFLVFVTCQLLLKNAVEGCCLVFTTDSVHCELEWFD